ncbi:hypothetical protein AX16_008659 [Volvariella volvacea WC 439]|nr:hypothetical protein AX16_008659 [Volvariella volvacea WC 439]
MCIISPVWISPINQNYEGPRTAYGDPYHGYWIADVTKLNDRFGTEDDLKALVAEVHRRGMYIMVDVVVNNVMAPSLTPDWSKYMFKDPSFYHPYCPIQWGNATSEEECWMGDERVPLPDLDTRNPAVVSQYGDWIENLVREYEIDGLRIDAAKHVNMDFWPDFASRAGVFCMGEVFSGIEVDPVAQWQGPQALDSVLNFPMYQALADAFAIPGPQNMSALTVTLQEARSKFKDVSVLGNFLENHDVPRWHNKSVDPQSLYNAMVLSFMTDGIPVVYYGLEQGFAGAGDPYNREALWPSGYAETYTYKLMAKLNRVRNYLVSSTDWLDQETRIISSNDHAIAISKGHVITVATNIGSPPRNNTAIAFSTPYESSTPLTNIVTCQEWVVGSQGMAQVEYTKGGAAVVLVPNDVLESSGVCQDDSEPDDHSGLKASDYSNSAARPTTPWLSSLTGIMLIFIALRFY